MRQKNTKQRIPTLLTTLVILAGLLSSGCSGLRVHRPADLEKAQAAQTQLEAANLTETVAAERARLDKVLENELELIRKHALARRDARLIYVIGNGDLPRAWEFLEADLNKRLCALGFDPVPADERTVADQAFPEATRKQLTDAMRDALSANEKAKLATAETCGQELPHFKTEIMNLAAASALKTIHEIAAKRWAVQRTKARTLPNLSCPLGTRDTVKDLAKLKSVADATSGLRESGLKNRYNGFVNTCLEFIKHDTFPLANKDAISKLKLAQAAIEEANEASLQKLSKLVDEALILTTNSDTSTANKKVLDAFENLGEFGTKLQEIKDAEKAVAPLGLSAVVKSLEANASTIKLDIEQGNVMAALADALGNPKVENYLSPYLQGKDAAKVIAAFTEVGTTVKAARAAPGPVTALLMRQQQLDLAREAANKREAFFDDAVALLGEQNEAYRTEVRQLGHAMRFLNSAKNAGCFTAPSSKGSKTKPIDRWGLTKLFNSSPEKKCVDTVFRMLTHYSTSWSLGRVAQEQVDQRVIGLQQQAALDQSEIAFARWQSLLSLPVGQLVALYETGLKPQDILDLLNLLGLGWIAVGVN